MSLQVKIDYRSPKTGQETTIFKGDEMGEGACRQAIEFLEDLTVDGAVVILEVTTSEDFNA